MRTWLLVTDGAHAHVFETDKVGGPLSRVADIVPDETLRAGHDIVSDRPGRTHEFVGQTRHAIEPRMPPHQKAKLAFIDRVGKALNAAAAEDRFDRVVIAAPPAALGELRKVIDRATAGLIAAEVAKDLVKVAPGELRSHIDGTVVI